MTLDTLLLLKRCLDAQQLSASDPNFADTARRVAEAQAELAEAIEEAGGNPEASLTLLSGEADLTRPNRAARRAKGAKAAR